VSIVNKTKDNEKNKGNNTKYIHFVLIAAAFVGWMYFSAPNTVSNPRAYIFNGSNGFISLTSTFFFDEGLERFIYGVLFFNGAVTDIRQVDYTFFFYDDEGIRNNIYTANVLLNPNENIYFIELATSSTGGLLHPNPRIDNIVASLHLELSLISSDGSHSYSLLPFKASNAFEPLIINP